MKGKSFEKSLGDHQKYDMAGLKRLRKAYEADLGSWMRQCHQPAVETTRAKIALVDAEIERRQSDGN